MGSRWLTNLEAIEHLQQELERAQAISKANPSDKEAKGMVEIAKFKLADVQNTLNKIYQECPGATIGQPMATEWRTAEAIAADGIVGIYKPGKGAGEFKSVTL